MSKHYSFGAAGSGTGKESIMQALFGADWRKQQRYKLRFMVLLSPKQEIMRNLNTPPSRVFIVLMN